jgi:hypothetical protein
MDAHVSEKVVAYMAKFAPHDRVSTRIRDMLPKIRNSPSAAAQEGEEPAAKNFPIILRVSVAGACDVGHGTLPCFEPPEMRCHTCQQGVRFELVGWAKHFFLGGVGERPRTRPRYSAAAFPAPPDLGA